MSARRLAPLLALVGSGLVVLLAGRDWVRGVLSDQTLAAAAGAPVVLSGGEAAPGVRALALVAAAAAVSLALSGPRPVRLLAVVLVLTGLGTIALVLGVAADPAAVLARDAARLAGVDGLSVADPGTTASLWASALAAAMMVAAGVLAWSGAAGWGRPSGRRPEDAPAAEREPDPFDAWTALDRGEDPTEPPPRGDRSSG